jgi:signal transduction histidine kinase
MVQENVAYETSGAPPRGVAEIHWLLDQVSQEDTVSGVSEVLVAGMVHLLRAGMATLHVRGDEPGVLALQAWHTVDPRFPIPRERLLADDAEPAAEAIRRRSATFVAARDLAAREVGRRALPASACLFVAPLIAGPETLGVLACAFARQLQQAEREAIASVVAPAAAFLHRALLLAERGSSPVERLGPLLPEDLHQVLVRTEKLRALGEMAAGISHDFKNILSPLSLYIQLLRRAFQRGGDGPARCEEALAEMAHVIDRGVQTADRLRAFSRHAPEAPAERIDLEGMVNEAFELCRPRLACGAYRRGITLRRELAAARAVEVHASEMVLALLNLMHNAIDAVGDGGTVVISTGDGDGDGGVWARVADDGPGVPDALRERIFDPFFTTKGDHGTGLGLAMVRACALRHGGRLTLEPTNGHGAVFTLWLPAAGPRAEQRHD